MGVVGGLCDTDAPGTVVGIHAERASPGGGGEIGVEGFHEGRKKGVLSEGGRNVGVRLEAVVVSSYFRKIKRALHSGVYLHPSMHIPSSSAGTELF